MAITHKIANYFKEVRLELGKVTWSSRDDLVASTVVVLVSLAILSVFIGICDLLLSRIVNVVMLMARY